MVLTQPLQADAEAARPYVAVPGRFVEPGELPRTAKTFATAASAAGWNVECGYGVAWERDGDAIKTQVVRLPKVGEDGAVVMTEPSTKFPQGQPARIEVATPVPIQREWAAVVATRRQGDRLRWVHATWVRLSSGSGTWSFESAQSERGSLSAREARAVLDA